MESNNKKLLAIGASATLLIAAGYFLYSRKNDESCDEQTQRLIEVNTKKSSLKFLTDSDYEGNHFLTRAEANSRFEIAEDVKYTLALALCKGG